MTEFAVFTKEIAEELIARGFKMVGYTDKAWFFENSVSLERDVGELTAALTDDSSLA